MAAVTPSVYDRWARCYPPTAHNPLMVAEQAAMVSRLSGMRARRALDVGAGSGRYSDWLRAHGVPEVVSLDQSHAMLMAHTVSGRRVQADTQFLPCADGVFDLVVAGLLAGDIPDLAPWLREVHRVLQPGGQFVYSDFHPGWAARGWRRSFTDIDGGTAVVPYHPHSHSDHWSASARAGFAWVSLDEVSMRPARLPRWLWTPRPARVPTLVVVSLVKPLVGTRA